MTVYTLEETKPLKPTAKAIQYVIEDSGCWKCVSHPVHSTGYTRVCRNGRKVKLHRYAYELMKEPIPEGNVLRHNCDDAACVNPDHMTPGTQVDNIYDMWERDRVPLGSARKNSKLTEEDIPKIYHDPRFLHVIADDYGVTKCTIFAIKHRKTWKQVEV
jgi:hypothetical protein